MIQIQFYMRSRSI